MTMEPNRVSNRRIAMKLFGLLDDEANPDLPIRIDTGTGVVALEVWDADLCFGRDGERFIRLHSQQIIDS